MSLNKINYLNFELYCINKHIEEFNEETYHWSNIPDKILIDSGYFKSYEKLRLRRKKNKSRILQEYGLDAISLKKIDENKIIYNGLQMKLWNNTICANHLGTFMSVIYNRFIPKSSESLGYLYYTSKLENNLMNDFISTKKIIPIKVNNPFNNNNTNNEPLRYYQKNAIENLMKDWEGIGLLNMPCGTGKTRVFCEYLKIIRPKNIFIFSPLKILTEQNLDSIKNYLLDYESILFDSDGINDFSNIHNKLNKNIICSSTYKSANNILFKLFDTKNKNKINLDETILIIDEAHNLLNLNKMIRFIEKFKKVLLVTATPPIQMEEIIPFQTIYSYSIRQAIEDKFICDYMIYLPYSNNEIPNELKNLDKNISSKCLFFINGLLKTGSRKTIVYLKNTNEFSNYRKIINEIMEKYHFYNVKIYEISTNTKQKDRNDILNDFQNNDTNIIKIILSIRILDEGIDIIKCDSIFISHINDNTNNIKLIQRIFRSNRIDLSNPNKIANIFIWINDTNEILDNLQLLKNNDIKFNKKIIIENNNYNNIKKNKCKLKIKNIELINNIDILCLNEKELWEVKKNLLFEYCNLYNKVIKGNHTYKNQNIGIWYSTQKNKLKKNFEQYKYIYDNLILNIYVKQDLDIFIDKNNGNIANNKILNEKSYYKCCRCNHLTKQKNDMKKHLDKEKKCKIINITEKSEIQLYWLSLEKIISENKLDKSITENKIIEKVKSEKKYICKDCNKCFHNKSNLNKHIKNNICQNIKNAIEKIVDEKINDINNQSNINNISNLQQINNIIGVQNNIVNININTNTSNLRGFDEDWNLSNISNELKEKLVLSDKKFTSTLKNILENTDNLNVILKDNTTGFVYKNKNNNYEAMPVNEILEEAMDKIYKHLRNFFTDIINNNKNDIRLNILENEIKEVDKKYNVYKKSVFIKKPEVNQYLSDIFDSKKQESINQYLLKKKTNNLLQNNDLEIDLDY